MEETRTLIDLRACYDAMGEAQKRVALLAGFGLLDKQTAARLGISEKTVKNQRNKVYHKLKIHSGIELCQLLLALGLTKNPFADA